MLICVCILYTIEKRRHVHPTGFDVQYRYTDTENSNPNIMISGYSRTKTAASHTSLFTCAHVNVTSPAVERDNCSPSGFNATTTIEGCCGNAGCFQIDDFRSSKVTISSYPDHYIS
ncbi:hypothetical protein DCAR_0729921 [Daucus carota subsp. sativus]|uniref:Uncharacterized protein n=1 Tax=Daucus carota subsp. sativus TaxID=79200 RepID=A0A164UJV8_DAUCS|nr:hypothetical protein DCAR_0729921 [Daucus carota subsp. sativus]